MASTTNTTPLRKDRVRLIALMQPKEGTSLKEFDQYWIQQHGPLFASLDVVKKNLSKYEQVGPFCIRTLYVCLTWCVRSRQFHLNQDANAALSAAMGVPPPSICGMAIFEAESFEKIFEVFQSEEYQRVIVPDEQKFMAREKSQLIAGDLATIIGL